MKMTALAASVFVTDSIPTLLSIWMCTRIAGHAICAAGLSGLLLTYTGRIPTRSDVKRDSKVRRSGTTLHQQSCRLGHLMLDTTALATIRPAMCESSKHARAALTAVISNFQIALRYETKPTGPFAIHHRSMTHAPIPPVRAKAKPPAAALPKAIPTAAPGLKSYGLGQSDEVFVLDGLHLPRQVSKDRVSGQSCL